MDTFARRLTSRVLPCCVLGVLCAISLLAPAALQAQSLPLYTVSPGDDLLRTVDPLTGVTLNSTPITLAGQTVTGGNGLAKHPFSGLLYAILKLQGQAGRELVTIDPTTGVATDIGNTGHLFAGIAFWTDPIGEVTLVGVAGAGDPANPDDLFFLDLATGAAILVDDRTLIATGGETIAFNPIDGQLYHAFGFGTPNTDQFFEKISLNPATLVATNIPLSVDSYFEATALTHWAGNMFLLGDLNDGLSSNLFVVTSDGKVRFLSTLDHVAKGLVFAGTPPTCPPAAGTLFGTAFQGPDGPSLLYRLDSTTGAPTLIGPVGFELVGGIAFNASGSLFGVGERSDGTNTNVLLTIDPCTGAGTELGPTGIEALTFTRIMDISFRHSDGTLFAFLFGTPGAELATINTSTGQVTLIGLISAAAGAGNGIAFSGSDTLFHADAVNLNTLDPATGAPTLVAALGFSPPADNVPRINAMDFEPPIGRLVGSVNDGQAGATENYLAEINTTTGVVTLVNSPNETQAGLDAIAFVPVPPVAAADLSVNKSGAPNPVIEGDNLTYTIGVTNNGPSGATGVTLTDPLPAGVTFVSATPGQGICSNASGTVTCNLGNIASAAQVAVTIVARPTGAASLSNTASVTGAEVDPVAANNSATATGSSLGFTLSNTSGTVTLNAGQTGQFTIRVTPGAGGFPNAVTFASSNLPAETTASFNPTSTTPGNAAVDVTFSLATTAPANLPPPSIPLRGPWPVTVPLLTACALLLLWFVTRRQDTQFRRPLAFLPLAALLFCAASFFGCNGRTLTGGTPAGTYNTVTVTATSGTASHTQAVTLVVQ